MIYQSNDLHGDRIRRQDRMRFTTVVNSDSISRLSLYGSDRLTDRWNNNAKFIRSCFFCRSTEGLIM